MSTLLFWQGRGGKAASGVNGNGSAAQTQPPSRQWLHVPDQLLKGHVAYLVKFLGSTNVEQPKGIDVVKDAIRRLQFSHQLKKSETGAKTKKVEITISVDGVAIQEPRTNNILHQFPLHRISYCADDKEAKKFFSFIAKGEPTPPTSNGDSNGNSHTNGNTTNENHECFVFISNKLASEITLTIGQAFDLAYRRFLMERGAGAEAIGAEAARARAQAAEMTTRVKELSALLSNIAPNDLNKWLLKKGIAQATDWTPAIENGNNELMNGNDSKMMSNSSVNHIADLMNDSFDLSASNKTPSVGTKLEGLLLNSDSDSDFDPRAAESDPPSASVNNRLRINTQMSSPAIIQNGTTPPPLIAPPPKATPKRQIPNPTPANNTSALNGSSSDLFGSAPFSSPTYNIPQTAPPALNLSQPNYNISEFDTQTSVFGNGFPPNNTNGIVGFDPFDTGKFSGITPVSGSLFNSNNMNGFSNPMGNGFSNGFPSVFPFDKQANQVTLDSSFTGFLDKRISEMKVNLID